METNDTSEVQSLTQDGLPLIMKATKCVNAMPAGRSRDLYNSHNAYRGVIKRESNRILEIISTVVRAQGIRGSIVKREDTEEKFELLQECNDAVLEKINSNLDDLFGIRNPGPLLVIQDQENDAPESRKSLNSSWLSSQSKTWTNSVGVKSAKLLTARNIQRPQASFKTPVDNSATPFIPRLAYKPHSIKPLSILPEYDDDGYVFAYTHPYETEIEKFEPSEELLKEKEPIMWPPIETADIAYIDDSASLAKAIKEIEQADELAVDVEHHSYRTFQGITCLLQISTRTKDYIFDTIALRDELHALNEIFCNPKVLKVFHGATMDIDWLQRDLSIYVVNMFDTFEAARLLSFARLSLSFLLSHFCQIDADKTFQLADWRMRPLPEELIDYARQDTHYLLYIYDRLRNQLLKAGNGNPNLLRNVYQLSKETCKKRYTKPVVGPNSFMDVYRKSKRTFDNRQLFALQKIFAWRDKTAREEDESYGFVLPNHMMLQIAENLPREMQGILACCNPIPPLVKQHLPTLHQFILKAREQSLIKAVMEENANRESQISNHRDFENPLYCPHDVFPVDKLPCMFASLDSEVAQEALPAVELANPTISVFGSPKKTARMTVPKGFVSPFQRYKAYLPIANSQKPEEDEPVPQLCPEKHKLAEDEEPDTPRLIKKRKMNLPGPSHAIQIFNGEAYVSEDEEKAVVEDLAHSRVAQQTPKGKGNQKKPMSKKKQRKLERWQRTRERTQEQVESPQTPQNGGFRKPVPVNAEWRTPRPGFNQKPSQFKKNRQDSSRPVPTIDLTKVDYGSRFGGGSKQAPKKQFEVTQKFKSTSQNKKSFRGNFKK